jgi:2-amino-4-hydroxy-6-hydroxymethyldihydropteridine diphosphokinase
VRPHRSRYWLGLGSNLGDSAGLLRRALVLLGDGPLTLEAVSSAYDTSPRDLLDQPAFVNAAARVRTGLEPPELLDLIKDVEQRLGRPAGGVRFGPRPIDCDLLLWDGGAFRDARLEIPHPRLRRRRFALVPLLELDPKAALPDGTPLRALEAALDPREQRVERMEGVALAPGLH